MTQVDEQNNNNTNTCWICTQEISENKVRDHCHITGKFRGAAHKECNSKVKIPKNLLVIFHNSEGYDGHFIFRELNNFTNINIDVILKSTEKYMSIIINKSIIFLDSLQFSKSTLDNLAANLEDASYKYLTEFPQDKLNLLKEKDAFPYEWIDDYRKFLYPNHPPKNAYYSRLKTNTRDGGDITEETYEHSKNVWQTLNFKNVRDSHDHCLKKDVFFLAGIFERSIKACLKYYNLDPFYYFSVPGLSLHAMLKLTNIELEKLVTQINIFLLKKEWGVVLIMLQENIVKQIMNFVLTMITPNQELKLNTTT